MLRPTSEQIDAGIVDAAAALFAEHGYERTSLREIAEAVGYSKTGLLHRFRSKDALLAAVAESCLQEVRDVLEEVSGLPEGSQRDTSAATALAALGVSAPGRLALALAQEGALLGTPFAERLAEVPALLAACFGPADGGGLERSARVTAALAASVAVAESLRHRPADVVGPLLVRIALDVLHPAHDALPDPVPDPGAALAAS